MTETKIDIRNTSLFPWHFLLLAVLIMMAGIIMLFSKPMIGFVLITAAGFILTAGSGTEIDKGKNMYREYSSFYFSIKSGKWKKFNGAEKLFINSSKKNTQMHTAHTNHSSVFTDLEFNGYLKLNDGTKIHLLTSRKKEKLAATLRSAASFLQVPLQDNTIGNT
jgi:hypothetical protein